MNRRSFIRQSCAGCGAIAAMGWSAALLQACKTPAGILKAQSEQGWITIFRNRLDPNLPTHIVRDDNLEYDILLIRENEGWRALYMQCTHENSPVYLSGTQIFCNSHGSRFNLTGEVLQGPASVNLRRFEVKEEHDALKIKTA
ncbi:MAG: Rieske (2Fe-2S) protein [Chitinophagales bacterium]